MTLDSEVDIVESSDEVIENGVNRGTEGLSYALRPVRPALHLAHLVRVRSRVRIDPSTPNKMLPKPQVKLSCSHEHIFVFISDAWDYGLPGPTE